MINELKNIRITYKEAEVDLRGQFSMSASEREQFYLQLRDVLDINEAIVLSTCNRTEVFYVHKQDLGGQIIDLLGSFKCINQIDYKNHFHIENDGNESLKHLFHLGIGLDSLILGDIQIYGQVKQAYQEATDLGMAQTLIHRALHALFYAHKQVCQQTQFKDGSASVSYNSVRLLKDRRLIQPSTKILVAGAGKMGTDVCRNLIKLGYDNVSIVNRTLTKSQELERELGIKVVNFSELETAICDYEVLISAMGANSPIFTEKLVKHQDMRSLGVVDLCSPKSCSQGFISSFTSHYFDIDTVGSLLERTLTNREAEIPKVKVIIDECLEEFKDWAETFVQTRQIKVFKETLDELRKASLAEYVNKLDEQQTALVEQVSKSIIQRIVKLPVLQLKQTCQKERQDQLSETLNELFNLEYLSTKQRSL